MDTDKSLDLSIRSTKDGSPTLFSERYQQTYHSIHGSITESNHIFLDATGVRDLLQKGVTTRILEVGLGTGLNFLLTASEANTAQVALDYWAFEHTVISRDTFFALHLEDFIRESGLLRAFADALDSLAHVRMLDTHSFAISPHIQLHVMKGDATEMHIPDRQFHAAYHDAFSPDVNPELWSRLFFQRIYDTMQPGGRLSTFSARRVVRDNLTAAGFVVQKRPGPPGGKREMVLAIKPDHEQSDE